MFSVVSLCQSFCPQEWGGGIHETITHDPMMHWTSPYRDPRDMFKLVQLGFHWIFASKVIYYIQTFLVLFLLSINFSNPSNLTLLYRDLPDMFKLVQLGFHCAGTSPDMFKLVQHGPHFTGLPKPCHGPTSRHVQTCSLWRTYLCKRAVDILLE